MLKSPTHSAGSSFKTLLKLGKKERGPYSHTEEKPAQLAAIQSTQERVVSAERHCCLGQPENLACLLPG